MAPPIRSSFSAAPTGAWRIDRIVAVRGATLATAARLHAHDGPPPEGAAWTLTGVTSHARYVERDEQGRLEAVQPPLGRAEATRAALIPILKSQAWWDLPQDERRAIFEEQSHHIAEGLKALPAVARRLYHSREIGGPFDFLTWFEFAPEHEPRFDELVALLRASPEWRWVEREVDVRLSR